MMFFWFVIIGILIYLLAGGTIKIGNPSSSAEKKLDERLASGEISIEEYNRIKNAIKGE